MREAVDVDGLAGEWVRPKGDGESATVLLYFHGGGYVFGSLAQYRDLTARLALATGGRVLVVDYRQAPEHPFPAAVDDAVRAYRWLRASRVAAEHIAIGGDSSGGALAVATMLVLRDAKDDLPAGAVLLSPWVDLEVGSASVVANAKLDWGDRDYLLHWARMYLGGADPRSALASPLRARLDGLPPLFIQVGGAELLLDEVTELAQLAEASGVSAELQVYGDMVHAWAMNPTVFPQARDALERIGDFVARRERACTS